MEKITKRHRPIPQSITNNEFLPTYIRTDSCSNGEAELWGVCYNIEETLVLDLGGQHLGGEIPPEIGELKNLIKINLRNNNLTGPIPGEIGKLKYLTFLFLMNNELTGNIPPEIGKCTGLSDLHLQNNRLSGQIPREIGKLKNLSHLMLYSNKLSGEIPSTIGNCKVLGDFEGFQNQLSGDIPKNLSRCPLHNLNLYSNELTGWKLPQGDLGPINNLKECNLAHNMIDELPAGIVNFTKLRGLQLFDNFLTTLPEGFCKLRYEVDKEANQLMQSMAFGNTGGDGAKSSIELDNKNSRVETSINLKWNNFCPPYPECLTGIETAAQWDADIYYADWDDPVDTQPKPVECIQEGDEEDSYRTTHPNNLINADNRSDTIIGHEIRPGSMVTERNRLNQMRPADTPKPTPSNITFVKNKMKDYRFQKKHKPGKYFKLASGLQVIIHKQGTGRKPKLNDILTVDYHGTLEETDKVFSSSVERGDAYTFELGVGNVIAGWDEGFKHITEGSEFTFIIPADLAYKDKGSPDGSIPPNSNLIFEITLMEIK